MPLFDAEGEIDHEALKNEVDFMINNGITGLFVNGLASEALMLSDKDRDAATKTIIETVDKRVPIMGNIIANSIKNGKEQAKTYEELGVDAIIITPPVVYKYTSKGILDFYKQIADSVDLPVYIYNAPETGNKLSPQQVTTLFNENPNFRGYKDSTQNIIEQQTTLSLLDDKDSFELLAGSDAQIVTTMMLGGKGVISLISVVYPELIVDLVKACKDKNWDKAIELQDKVLRVREALKTGPFMSAYKYVSEQLGRPLGQMCPPLSDLSEEDKEKITALLKEQNML